MILYAVTYTDPHEPWGAAIWEDRLYRTPSEVLDALNRCFDEHVDAWGDALRRQMFEMPENYRRFDDDGWSRALTFLEAAGMEFSREFGVGRYVLVDS